MSPPHPWLSVLVPFYRVEPYLRECVESVLAQVDGGVEIVLLDDASPDNCATIARDLRKAHGDVIRLLGHDRNRGIAEARNTLLADARGDYVWFLDSDDLMLPGAIAGLKSAIARTGADLVLCDFRVVRERMALKHRLRGELHRSTFAGPTNSLETDRRLLVRGVMSARQLHPWSKIARRLCWGSEPFPSGRVVLEDAGSIPALLASVTSFIYVPECWIGFRQSFKCPRESLNEVALRDGLVSVRDLHAALAFDESLDPHTRFAVDYFCIRTLSALCRRISREEPDLISLVSCTLRDLYPNGVHTILDECRRRGWWIRQRRVRRSVAQLECRVF